jgi:hypothetical protein
MTPLELVQLPALMAVTSGSEEIMIALLDGPVTSDYPDLLSKRIQDIAGECVVDAARPAAVPVSMGRS